MAKSSHATNLYSLNKDELVYLISTIETTNLVRIAELEKDNENYKKTLTGHRHYLQLCKSQGCQKFANRIDEDYFQSGTMWYCDNCRADVCDDHSFECFSCEDVVCQECSESRIGLCTNCDAGAGKLLCNACSMVCLVCKHRYCNECLLQTPLYPVCPEDHKFAS